MLYANPTNLSDYYVYALIDPSKPTRLNIEGIDFTEGTPFYIGKGRKYRAKEHLMPYSLKNKSRKNSKIKNLIKRGILPLIKFISKGITESSAYELEIKLIDKIGMYNLTNVCKGGQGRDRESMLGEKNPMYGKKRPKWLIEKLQKARALTNGNNKGKTFEEILGKEKSDVAKQKMSKKRKGKSYIEIFGSVTKAKSVIKKQVNKRIGRKHTSDTLIKMSKSANKKDVINSKLNGILKYRKNKFNNILKENKAKVLMLFKKNKSIFFISKKVGISRFMCKKILNHK